MVEATADFLRGAAATYAANLLATLETKTAEC
jgi:hypothetical protein